MAEKNILVELPADDADFFIKALDEKGVKVVGSDQIDSLDGTTLAAIIITVTPVLSKAIVHIIKSIRGSVVSTDGKKIKGENLTLEELDAVLRHKDDSPG